jgi:hypothetical protein
MNPRVYEIHDANSNTPPQYMSDCGCEMSAYLRNLTSDI